MTEREAKGFVQGKLDCMKKCGVFNKEDNISDNDCDNCEYCYSQGNFGKQREAFQIAIKALEKQIPKKPIFDNYHRAGYRCPDCNNTNPWGYKHCKHCGQKLDWSDRE